MSLKCMRERAAKVRGRTSRRKCQRETETESACERERSDDRLFFTFPLLTADVISILLGHTADPI